MAHLVSLAVSFEVEGLMIAQKFRLDEAVHPLAKIYVELT